jgi:hypothetical protein
MLPRDELGFFLLTNQINDVKTNIVPGMGVFWTRVPKSHDQPFRGKSRLGWFLSKHGYCA